MRWIYSAFMYALIPFLVVRLWWKGRAVPAYRSRVDERFAVAKDPEGLIDVWVHAVSLGEVIAATPLIDTLLRAGYTVLVTTMTPTGAERTKARFGNNVVHRYIPYDLSFAQKRFFRHIRPRVGVVMETELWPNLIHHAWRTGVPLILANARLSERSLSGYKKGTWLFKPLLHHFSAILPQSTDDAQRFIALGAPADRVQVRGNMKFDVVTDAFDSAPFELLKQRFGSARVTVIAASTHEDEEAQILAQLPRLQQAIPGVVLLIAPRHPERFQKVYQLCGQQGFHTGLRSEAETLSRANEVVVLDCLGELLGLFQVSDYAFVGGSFVPVGGHNVLEPIAMHVPVFSGPHVHNFKTICRDLQAACAIQIVPNAEALMDAISAMHQNNAARKQMVANATQVLELNKGSVIKHLQVVEQFMLP